jgi:hypothetical protein
MGYVEIAAFQKRSIEPEESPEKARFYSGVSHDSFAATPNGNCA